MAKDLKDLFSTPRLVQAYKSPTNGKTYHFRELSSAEGDVYVQVLRKAQDGFSAADQRTLAAAVLCWPDGERLGELDEVTKALEGEPSALVADLFLQSLSVNGGTKAEVEAEKKD